MDLCSLWKDDAITGSCDLSTSDHEDVVGIESRFDGYRVYGTTVIFFGRHEPILSDRLFVVFGNVKLL